MAGVTAGSVGHCPRSDDDHCPNAAAWFASHRSEDDVALWGIIGRFVTLRLPRRRGHLVPAKRPLGHRLSWSTRTLVSGRSQHSAVAALAADRRTAGGRRPARARKTRGPWRAARRAAAPRVEVSEEAPARRGFARARVLARRVEGLVETRPRVCLPPFVGGGAALRRRPRERNERTRPGATTRRIEPFASPAHACRDRRCEPRLRFLERRRAAGPRSRVESRRGGSPRRPTRPSCRGTPRPKDASGAPASTATVPAALRPPVGTSDARR